MIETNKPWDVLKGASNPHRKKFMLLLFPIVIIFSLSSIMWFFFPNEELQERLKDFWRDDFNKENEKIVKEDLLSIKEQLDKIEKKLDDNSGTDLNIEDNLREVEDNIDEIKKNIKAIPHEVQIASLGNLEVIRFQQKIIQLAIKTDTEEMKQSLAATYLRFTSILQKTSLEAKLTCSPQIPSLFFVNVQNQKIPAEYKYWIKDTGATAVTEEPFFIMRKEITVANFECYFNNLPRTQQEKIGRGWFQDDKNSPLFSINWEEAYQYAQWLSEYTGSTWNLPSYNQWLAAVIYSKPNTEQAICRENASIEIDNNGVSIPTFVKTLGEPESIVDLLGNLREWSSDACKEDGHFTLGTSYAVSRDKYLSDKRKPFCFIHSDTLSSSTLGFRLVRLIDENIKL